MRKQTGEASNGQVRSKVPGWLGVSALILLFAVQGRAAFDEFEIPSLFPYLVMPFLFVDASVPASLWVNFAAMLLLLGGLHGLRRELGLRTPTPVLALLVLSSPILIGLSRTLYIEFTLTAMATVVFALWLRFLRRLDWPSGVAFGATFGLAYMTKTTFHLFMLAPKSLSPWRFTSPSSLDPSATT
jgi:hypothetical protein